MSYNIPSYFTDEQKEAVLLDNTNILVSAAAGCGKTTLMIERIIRKVILNNVSIDQIVVVTFTEAAAAELKERLESSLNKQLSLNPHNEFIKHQLSIINDSYISTFHSLCLRLLKENKVEFKYDLPIKIGDNLQLNNLRYHAFLKLDELSINDENYQNLRDFYTTLVDDSSLFELFNSTLELCITNSSIESMKEYHFNIANFTSILDYPIFCDIFKNECFKHLDRIINLCDKGLLEDVSEKTTLGITNLKENLISLTNAINNNDYSQSQQIANSISIFRQPSSKVDKATNYPAMHKIIKEVFQKKLLPLFEVSHDDYITILKTNNNKVLLLLDYVEKYHNIVQSKKKELGLLDYNDLEQETLKLLYNSDNSLTNTALELKKYFNEIMIDEYQDTSLIQEKIANAISNGNNTFMVGDLKQSIYQFRNATPKLFSDKYVQYQNSDLGHVISLSSNFRSKNDVLEATNFIFKSIFTKECGGVDYDSNQQLNFGNTKLDIDYPNNYPTKLFVNYYSKEDKLNSRDKFILTAKAIANEIKVLVNNNNSYKDIVILSRNRSNITLLTQVLEEESIPYMLHTKSGFFNSYEIKDLINLLKVITNKNDDYALIATLRSYFFNLNENDLLTLATINKPSYYAKLKASQFTNEANLLDELIAFAKDNHVLALVNYIYDNTPYKSYIQNHNKYEQFLMNISLFKDKIINNIDYYNSLSYLISDLEQDFNIKEDNSNPAVLSEKDNVVNIMTIHKSKGLEFNYVFLLDEADFKKTSSPAISHLNNQLILSYFDSKQRVKMDNPLIKLSHINNRKDNLAEEFRVLYVALTRAKLQLYIFRNIDIDKHESNLINLGLEVNWSINQVFLDDFKKMSDGIIYSFARHKNGLKLRESTQIDVHNDIYHYYDNLFNIYEYDFSLLNEKSSSIKSTYNLEYVSRGLNKQKNINFLKPSNHEGKLLDFNDIKTYDTYLQGSNIHKVFELVNFNSSTLFDDLLALFIKFNIYKNNYDGINSFFKTDLFKIIKENKYYKEYSFSIIENDTLVRGVIDLYVETSNTIYIIDYKSDKLSIDNLKEAYQKQLKVYKNVISKNSDKKIKTLIFSLYNQDFIDII